MGILLNKVFLNGNKMRTFLFILVVLHHTYSQATTTTPAPATTTTAPVSTTTPPSQPECSHGWLDFNRVGLGCLYFDTAQTLTWNDAQEFCHQQERSFLLEILNEDQNEEIVSQVFNIASVTQENRNWWIGATDISF